MSTITISRTSTPIPNFRFSATTVYLRIFLREAFITSDGIPLQASSKRTNGWYQQYLCTLVGNDLTIPEVTIRSTVDGQDSSTATYSAVFVDSSGTELGAFQGFSQFRVPDTPSTWTWGNIKAYNTTFARAFDDSVYTKDQVNALLGEAGAPTDATFWISSANSELTNEVNLGLLTTGLVKVTVSGSVATPSIAVAADIPDLSAIYSPLAHTHTFASLTSKPTTLSGYGITDAQGLDATLTALAALNSTAGLVEQTGADAFTKRAIGVASATDIPTRADADTRYQASLGFTPENVANKATDFATVNHTLYPTVSAVKTYADSLVVGLLDDRGNFDASGNVFPSSGGSGSAGAILKGDLWTVSVAGTLGGNAVTAGDVVRALVDTPGQTASNWAVTENNFGYVAANAATTITVAGTANQITSSAGAQSLAANRTWTLSFPSDVLIPTVLTVPNTGLHLLDTDASHDLIIVPGSNLSTDRNLTLTTGDAARTVTISGDTTISQDYSTSGTPQFARLGIGTAAGATAKFTVLTPTATNGLGLLMSLSGNYSQSVTSGNLASMIYMRLDNSSTPTAGALHGIQIDVSGTVTDSAVAFSGSQTGNGDVFYSGAYGIAGATNTHPTAYACDLNRDPVTGTDEQSSAHAGFGMQVWDWSENTSTNSIGPVGIYLLKQTNANTTHRMLRINSNVQSIELVTPEGGGYSSAATLFSIITGSTLKARFTANGDLFFAKGKTLNFETDSGGTAAFSGNASGTTVDLQLPTGGFRFLNSEFDTAVFSVTNITGVQTISSSTLTAGTVNGTAFQVSGVALAASHLSNGVTGTGAVALATSPTFVTSIISPIVYGSSSADADLTIQASSASSTAAHILLNPIASGVAQGCVLIGASAAEFLAGGDTLHLRGADGGTNIIFMDSYGTGVSNGVVMRGARGTFASPTASQADDLLGQFGVRGYQTTTSAFSAANVARIAMYAAENYTSTTQGTYIGFETSASGGTTRTEKVRITDVGNVKIGGTATRATTEGTNQLVLFNGTAPVGTLTNGVSLYSASGELRVMDAAGNSTLLSPHDHVTNEWIYYSKNTVTGKVLRIDMERLVRAVDAKFGGGFIHEYLEECTL